MGLTFSAHLFGLRLAEVLEASARDDDLRFGRQVVLAEGSCAHLAPEQQAARCLRQEGGLGSGGSCCSKESGVA